MDLVFRSFNIINKEFLYAGHILSLGAAAVAYMSCLLFNLPVSLSAIISIYFFVQPIYWIDRQAGLMHDTEDNKERSLYLQQLSHWFIPFMCVVYISSFAIITLGTGKYISFGLGIFLFVAGAMYHSWFKQVTKYIPAFKDYFVGIFFVFFAIYIYVYTKTPIMNISPFIFFLYIFLRTILIQVFFDLKDIESDKKQGLKTYPVLLGKKKVLHSLMIINALSFFPIMYGMFYEFFPPISSVLIIPHIIYHIILTQEKNHPSYMHYVYMGFEYIIAALVLSFIYLL